MKLLNDEVLVYAGNLKKASSFQLLQQRTIAITSTTIYNIYKKKVKSSVKIENLLGISKTMPEGNELTIHVNQVLSLELPSQIESLSAYQ